MDRDIDPILGRVLFRCRPRPISNFLRAINRPSDLSHAGKIVTRINETIFPYLTPTLLAGNCSVLAALFLKALGLPTNSQGLWLTKLIMFGVLVASFLFCFWWYWVSPRKDYLVICENGFKWRIWLSKWNLFPNSGNVLTENLVELYYRPDWKDHRRESTTKAGTATEMVAGIILELSLTKRDLALRLGDNAEQTIENLMVRFDEEETQHFLDQIEQGLKK